MLVPGKAKSRSWQAACWLTGLQGFRLNHGPMKRDLAGRLESIADGFASVSLGGAVGVFVYHLPAPAAVQPLGGASAAAAAVVAYGIAKSLLGLVGRRLPIVAAANLEGWEGSDSRPVPERDASADSELDSPIVVRLFDPAKAAASGQSTARTGHLEIDLPRDAPSDASHSLHEALNQLRQSLANRR